MQVQNLAQPPCDTSLLGVVKGALDHYGIDCPLADAYVLSGHAFVINIHEEICPSAPYCWDQTVFYRLLQNAGLRMSPVGMLMPSSGAAERAELEASVRDALDGGAVCSLVNLDHQLVFGYDDEGFSLAQPWDGAAVDSTPPRLTFGTWVECLAGPPVCFYRLDPCEAQSSAFDQALDFAADLWRNPGRYTESPYAVSDDAYGQWLRAIDAGHGAEHGNWWNGVVWGECRERAADFFGTGGFGDGGPGGRESLPDADARWLAGQYRDVSRLLYQAADRNASDADKRRSVAAAREADAAAARRIGDVRRARAA